MILAIAPLIALQVWNAHQAVVAIADRKVTPPTHLDPELFTPAQEEQLQTFNLSKSTRAPTAHPRRQRPFILY